MIELKLKTILCNIVERKDEIMNRNRKKISKESQDNKKKIKSFMRRISALSAIIFYLSVIMDIISIFIDNVIGEAITGLLFLFISLFMISNKFGHWLDSKFPNKGIYDEIMGVVGISSIINFSMEKAVLPFVQDDNTMKCILIFIIVLLAILPIWILCIEVKKKEFQYNEE